MGFNKDELFFRQKLMEMIDDIKQVDAICSLYEKTLQCAEEDRKLKQLEGIRKARQDGRALGRPRIQEPDDFRTIAAAWQCKKLSAGEAAAQCGMGVSTFYRRVRHLRDLDNTGERMDDCVEK